MLSILEQLRAAESKVASFSHKVQAAIQIVKVIREDVLPAMEKLKAAVEEFDSK